VQHDCNLHECQPTGSRQERQERHLTERVVQLIQHSDDSHFVLNMHAIHNAHLLRRVLPRHLIQPRHLHEDRLAFHTEAALRLSRTKAEKKAAEQAKKTADQAQAAAKEAAAAITANSTVEVDLNTPSAEPSRKRIRTTQDPGPISTSVHKDVLRS
jgi:hypothetical protein